MHCTEAGTTSFSGLDLSAKLLGNFVASDHPEMTINASARARVQ